MLCIKKGFLSVLSVVLIFLGLFLVLSCSNDNEPTLYDVSYYSQGKLYNTQSVLAGNLAPQVSPPVSGETGFIFSHWSISENGSEYDFSTPVNANLTLYAVWTKSQHKVNFYSDNVIVETVSVAYGEPVQKPSNPLPATEGMTFLYWSIAENGEEFDFSQQITGDFSLYAVWAKKQCTVSFYCNGTVFETINVEYSEPVQKPGNPNPESEGMIFSHWSLKGNGESFDFDTPITSDMSLYAVFTSDVPVLPSEYVVKFYVDDTVIKEISVTEGDKVSFINVDKEYMPEGKEFLHWSVTPNGATFDFDSIIRQDLNLYAVWRNISAPDPENSFTVQFYSYDINDNLEDVGCEIVEAGQLVTPREGLWTQSITGGEVFDFNAPINQNITLYKACTTSASVITTCVSPNLESLIIPSWISEIGDYAFSECALLRCIVIPDSIISIGGSAFSGCTSIKQITVPSSVMFIGSSAFFGIETVNITIADDFENEDACKFSGVKILNILEGSNHIPNRLCLNCAELEKVNIPDTVISIGDSAFSGCSNLKEVTIPTSVTELGAYVFQSCYLDVLRIAGNVSDNSSYRFNVKKIEYLPGVTEISDINAEGVESVILSDTIEVIGDNAFEGFSNLKEIKIPSSVKEIGDSAFRNCSSLETINLPNKIENIGSYAFRGCVEIKVLTIPNSVISIGIDAFLGIDTINISISDKYTINPMNYSIFGGVKKINILPGTNKLPENMFRNATTLEYVSLNDNITEIGESAFYNCNLLKEIEIPNSIESIGDYAFFGCNSLTQILIPESVKSIGDAAFSGCTSISEVLIPDNVIAIGMQAFYGIDAISITISDEYKATSAAFNGVKKIKVLPGSHFIPDDMFKSSQSLEFIELNNQITEIGDSAFFGCSSLSELVIPSSVKAIGSSAFYGCSGIKNLIIPEGVTSIGLHTFSNCEFDELVFPESLNDLDMESFTDASIQHLVILNKDFPSEYLIRVEIKEISMFGEARVPHGQPSLGITKINYLPGTKIINHCAPSVQEVVIPESVVEIGTKAFSGTKIKEVILPETIEKIGDNAFAECLSLVSIKLPDSVSSIGEGIFSDCMNLSSVVFPDGITEIPAKTFKGCSSLESIELPQSIRTIGKFAFEGCSSLDNVELPPEVDTISDGMFSGCTSLKSISLPNNLYWIKDKAFSGCTSLKSIDLPDSVVSIGEYAFDGCSSIEEFEIPSKVSELTRYLFRNCSSLKSITIHENITTLWDSVFSGTGLEEINIPDNVTSIGQRVFENCVNLKSVTLPDSLREIPAMMFIGCTGLVDIPILSEETTSIGNHAFLGCTGLVNIEIPNSITSIDGYAFSGCTNLEVVSMSDCVRLIGYGVFSNCSKLTSIKLSNNLRSIPDNAFSNCSALKSFYIPSNVSEIGSKVFSGCSSLSTVTISDQVTSIGYNAFEGCSSLNSLYVKSPEITSSSAYYPWGLMSGTEIEWSDGSTSSV